MLNGLDEEVARTIMKSGGYPKCSEPDEFAQSGRCQGEMFEVLDGPPLKVTKIEKGDSANL